MYMFCCIKLYYATPNGRPYRVPDQITKGDPYQITIITSNVLFNRKMMFQPLVTHTYK